MTALVIVPALTLLGILVAVWLYAKALESIEESYPPFLDFGSCVGDYRWRSSSVCSLVGCPMPTRNRFCEYHSNGDAIAWLDEHRRAVEGGAKWPVL